MSTESLPTGPQPARTMMHMKSSLFIGAIALGLPLACSGNDSDNNNTGTGGYTQGTGGASATGGSSSSGGAGQETGGTDAGMGGTSGQQETGGTDAGMGCMGGMGGMGGSGEGDMLFIPEDIMVVRLGGPREGVNIVASTLHEGPTGPEFYAALINDGEVSACDAALSVEFFDKDNASVGAHVVSLHSKELYRRSDGTGALIACLDPGKMAMVSISDLPPSLVVDDVGIIVFQPTYFDKDIFPFELVPIDAFAVNQVESVDDAFSGMLKNKLGVKLDNPSVTIYPLNHVGRPLGTATSSSTTSVPSGKSWPFETTAVDNVGVDYVAYPSGSPAF